jgi:2'-5' RNA ligase
VASALASWQGEVVVSEPALRAVGSESLHVTLCFLGRLPPEVVEVVAQAMDRLEGRPARNLALGNALWLPSRQPPARHPASPNRAARESSGCRPRVLAVQLLDPLGQVSGLQAELAEALVAAGLFGSEARRFVPHVTVARVHGHARVQPRLLKRPSSVEFDARHVTLYRSHLGGGPARYEALHRTELSRR